MRRGGLWGGASVEGRGCGEGLVGREWVVGKG